MLRRIVATTVTGLCALAGPVSAPAALAAAAPVIALSGSSVRPGVAFTASTGVGCPEANGIQDVDFTYTDSAGRTTGIGSVQTDEDGSWTEASLQLPVTGSDDEGAWSSHRVAAGAGTVVATCFGEAESEEEGDEDPDFGIGDDPGTGENGDEDGDGDGDGEEGDEEEGDAVVTQTYAPAALTAAGSAPAFTLSATFLQPGGALTVTPVDACPGSADVEVDVVALSDDSETAVAEYTSTDALGIWRPVTVTLPDEADPGDYGVTAECTSGDDVTATYDGQGLGAGTLRLSGLDCGGTPVTARLTGTYDGKVAGVTPLKGRGRVSAPATVRLTGRGPWDLALVSDVTGAPLLTRTLTCPTPVYDLDVTRPGVDNGKVRARVCNTGNIPADAALQVRSGKRFSEVDDASLDAGDCAWLTGGRVAAGASVGARVLLDAPGTRNDEVSASFTVRRKR